MSPLRLLGVAAVDRPGGAEIGLLRLSARLQAAGWRVRLTTPGAGPLRDAIRAQALGWTSLPVGGLARGAGARALPSFPRVRRLARDADVVYLNGGVAARLLPALRGTGVRTVVHVHDLVERVPRFWSQADVVLADSAAVAERLQGLDAHVVGCPIEPAPARVEPPWKTNGRPVIGFVGRIEPRKAPLELVRAAPALRDAGARVVLVGDDELGADPAYAAQVTDAARAAGVERYGWVPDAAGLMGALDVLVLPSVAEPFGTVLAEAMNAGIPVVATRVGGLAEVVDDGVTGRLVQTGDPDALATAALEALARGSEWGAAGRERARRWHADAYAQRVAELIA